MIAYAVVMKTSILILLFCGLQMIFDYRYSNKRAKLENIY